MFQRDSGYQTGNRKIPPLPPKDEKNPKTTQEKKKETEKRPERKEFNKKGAGVIMLSLRDRYLQRKQNLCDNIKSKKSK